MAKKEKEFNYDSIKEYIESKVIESGLSDFVTSSIVSDDDDERHLECSFDSKGYTAHIICTELIASLDIEFNISYINSSTRFEYEDVFNVLDINDFAEYAFSGMIDDEKNQRDEIDNLIDFIKKYDYDFSKAGGEEYLGKMEEMHSQDEEIYSSDNLKLRQILRLATLKLNMQRKKTEKSKQKFLKEMKARESRGLLTNYDRRFMKYLEMGYPIPDNAGAEKDKDYSGYLKFNVISAVICIAVGIAFCVAVLFIDKSIMDSKGLYLFDSVNYILSIISGGILAYILHRVFATKIITIIAPTDQKEYFINERKDRFNDRGALSKIWSKYIVLIISVFALAVFLVMSCTGVCFTENYAIDHMGFMDEKIKYEDAEFYLVKGWVDDDGEYTAYESPYYRIEYNVDSSADTGEITNEAQLNELRDIFEKHNIKPIEAKE